MHSISLKCVVSKYRIAEIIHQKDFYPSLLFCSIYEVFSSFSQMLSRHTQVLCQLRADHVRGYNLLNLKKVTLCNKTRYMLAQKHERFSNLYFKPSSLNLSNSYGLIWMPIIIFQFLFQLRASNKRRLFVLWLLQLVFPSTEFISLCSLNV